jgi:hypothetical protein
MSTIASNKPGRPASVQRKAEALIGTAGFAALKANDLHIISGPIVRELALIVGEPQPEYPEAITLDESLPKESATAIGALAERIAKPPKVSKASIILDPVDTLPPTA